MIRADEALELRGALVGVDLQVPVLDGRSVAYVNLDLAGEGLTNTEIAERLYVSRRTIESHLGRVYAKLDLTTRAQLVAAAARRG